VIEDIIGAVILTATSAFLMHRQAKDFESRLAAQDATEEERRVALYKQQKATARSVAQSDRAVRKMVDQTRRLQEDTTLLQRRTDAHFAHPAVKRLTGQEGQDG
jgi:uncharacterized coiled-coil protein SlyX